MSSVDGLPAGWTKKISRSNGQPYYHNERTGQSQWELPTEGQEPDSGCKKGNPDFNAIRENMRKNDKYIGDILAPFEQVLGMQFNKFDKPEDPKYVDPKKKGGLKKKLRAAERKQDKMKKLNPDEVKKVHWQNAMDKAQGIKVKDDPKMIRKAIKRKEAEKKKHKKKWAERTEKLAEAKKIRQKKRKERIKKQKASTARNK